MIQSQPTQVVLRYIGLLHVEFPVEFPKLAFDFAYETSYKMNGAVSLLGFGVAQSDTTPWPCLTSGASAGSVAFQSSGT